MSEGMRHWAHQDLIGQWHAVYQIPGRQTLHSVGVANTERGAVALAESAEAAWLRREESHVPLDPWEPRRIPSGFYTDQDAA